jgi:hypothetical protein
MAASPAPRGAHQPQTDHAEQYLNLVRQRIEADDRVLKEARRRRDRVRALAEQFAGALRSFVSGSLAHGTVNKPVKDADSGVVLDRRDWSELGPDGDGVGSGAIVHDVAQFILVRLRREWPAVTCTITKRAILFEFHEPLGSEDPQEDPSVDLVVGLTRRDAPGLWIPNTEQERWDPSDPEGHTELMIAEPADLRVFRARIIRLTKTIISADGANAVLISFNIEALAYYHVRAVAPTLMDGLSEFLALAAASIGNGATPDPANVSPPIKLPDGISRQQAAQRLQFFASCAAEAQRHRYDAGAALAALGRLFPEQLPEAPTSPKGQLASALATGSSGAVVTNAFGRPVAKTTRSYGDAAA